MRRVALAIIALVAACDKAPAPPPVLVDPAGLYGPDLRLEQSVLGHFYGRDFLARGVIVKQGHRLDVFMLTPTGQRLYHVRQEGKQVTVHAAQEPWSRLDPLYLLRDVRFMFFERCEGAPECTKGAEVFKETADPVAGLPARIDVHAPSGDVEVRFEGAFECGEHRVPRKARLASKALDYSIEALVERCTVLAADP